MTQDLMTPLNEIIAAADGLLTETDGPLNDQQRQDVQIILRSSRRLSDMVAEIQQAVETGELKTFSHETRVLLNNIIGFASFWRNELPAAFGTLNTTQKEHMRKIHNSGISLFYMISTIVSQHRDGEELN
jgi:signal transduction histidine kinase